MAIPKDCLELAAKPFDPTRIHEKPEALRGMGVLDLYVIYFGGATADFLGELLLEERLPRLFLREPLRAGPRGHCLTGRSILLTRSVTPA